MDKKEDKQMTKARKHGPSVCSTATSKQVSGNPNKAASNIPNTKDTISNISNQQAP